MKKKTTARRAGKPQTWAITGLLASIAVAYVVFVFLPSQKSIGQLRNQVQERRQQILQAQSLTRTVSHSQERLQAAREVGRQWRAEAPRQADVVLHYASLSSQAKVAGVTIDRLDPIPAVELNLVAQQNVTLHFQSSFTAAFDLLKRLEELPGTIWTRELRLSADPQTGQTLRGEMTLTIFVDRGVYSD